MFSFACLVIRLANAKEDGKTIIYHGAGHEWRPFGDPKQVRTTITRKLELRNFGQSYVEEIDFGSETLNFYVSKQPRTRYALTGPADPVGHPRPEHG